MAQERAELADDAANERRKTATAQDRHGEDREGSAEQIPEKHNLKTTS